MEREHRVRVPAVGGSSLLVIFAVLCLSVFALLCLSSAQAGGRLSQTSAQAVTAYYQADCRAEEVFARLRAGELPDGVVKTGNLYAYTCPVSDTQQLQVELLRENDGWIVLRWQAESIAVQETDVVLDVWDGT